MNILFLRKVLAASAAFTICVSMFARQNRETSPDCYSVTALGVYDHSRTFGNRGGLDIAAHLPFNTYVESDVGFEYLGPKILAGTLVARPKLPLKVGELFLDAAVHLRAFHSFGTGNFSVAASIGYRMDYVGVQLGVQRTEIVDFQKKDGIAETGIVEFNPIIRVAFNVRPSTSPWNISLGAGNFTLYQYERLYCPIFFLGGHCNVADRLAVRAEVDLKPSGIFNYNSHFNELSARVGITYSFR